MFLRTNSYIFRSRHCQLYDCVLGIQDGGSKLKMAACDVIVTSCNVIIDTSQTQSVKLMTYKRAKFHHKSVNTFRDL